MSGSSVLDFPNCYVCGADNPEGLHVEFRADGPERCRALYLARREHEGWPGILHGGLLFTLMDEALAWALAYAGLRGVTAKGDVRFCAPARIGAQLVITAELRERRGKLVRARAEVRDAQAPDVLIAELDGAMYLTDVERWLDQS
jgi:acyl-coenzyme A thioesterase PaaI-like protein